MCLLLQACVLVVGTASGAQVYRWVDKDGKVHFSDRRPTAEEIEDVEVKSYEGTANISVVPGGYTTTTVKVLSASWCGICKKAKAHMKKLGVAFIEYDVEQSEIGKQEYRRLHGKGVPIILVGNQRMDGFAPAKLESMLKDAGLLTRP